MSTPVILYILECEHIQPGRMGVIEFRCMNCTGSPVRKIIDVHVYEWRMYCYTCNYRPWCGLSKELGNHHANGHVRKHPGHKAKVLYMKNPQGVKIQEMIQRGGYNVSASSEPKAG
jgi:hypothetical protein